MNKKGISAIVATVLIILITVAAVVIIWTAIIPMISEGFDSTGLDTRVNVVSSKGYTVYDPATRLVLVQVERNAGEADVRNVRITLDFEGTRYSSIVPAPGPNQKITYAFNLSVGDYPAPQSVSVVPIFIVGGSEKEGVASSMVDIDEGKIFDIPAVLYDLGEDYRSTTEPGCTDADNCTSPGQCQVVGSGACTDGSCSYGNKADGVGCDDGNAGTENDVCTAGVCSGTAVSTGCTGDGDCTSGGACTTASCNVGTGVCSYPAIAPTCPAAGTVACGVEIVSSNGCGTCSGSGTLCSGGNTCVSGTCVADLPACIDADGDHYCAQASGACTGISICSLGYSDCNDAVWAINEGADEICGDGIDNDCVGGDEACGTVLVGEWELDTGITSGLSLSYSYTCPTHISMAGVDYLVFGTSTGRAYGYYWTGSTWVSNAGIVSGIGDVGDYSVFEIFKLGTYYYLLSRDSNGLDSSYIYSSGSWAKNDEVKAGLSVGENLQKFSFFEVGADKHLLVGTREQTAYMSYILSGSWVVDSSFESGLPASGLESWTPSVFYMNGELYMISGKHDGQFQGYKWSGSTWQEQGGLGGGITTGLSDVGSRFCADTFEIGGDTYLIAGSSSGAFTGWKLV